MTGQEPVSHLAREFAVTMNRHSAVVVRAGLTVFEHMHTCGSRLGIWVIGRGNFRPAEGPTGSVASNYGPGGG